MGLIRFNSDYTEGAAPEILKTLTATNLEQTDGYGVDPHCERARRLILEACGLTASEADVHLLVGGTQTNTAVISAALRPHQGVISAGTGHINTHESGAIESSGHKVLVAPSENGKLSAEAVEELIVSHFADEAAEHTVQPGLVYISHPTELGTLYTLAELEALSEVCRGRDIPLFLDGARLAYGLTAPGSDLSLGDIARLCDVFYLGGTKCGALFGEALVIRSPALRRDFRYIIKQRGAMLAKGRLLGLQFEVLFEDGLYFRLGENANRQAAIIRRACSDAGLAFLADTSSNQIFPIFEDGKLAEISENFALSYWQRIDETHSAARICCSWATSDAQVEALINTILGVSNAE